MLRASVESYLLERCFYILAIVETSRIPQDGEAGLHGRGSGRSRQGHWAAEALQTISSGMVAARNGGSSDRITPSYTTSESLLQCSCMRDCMTASAYLKRVVCNEGSMPVFLYPLLWMH